VKLWKANDELIAPEFIDINTGMIRLVNPIANDETLSASFEFDVAVRFVNDDFQYHFNQDNTIALDDVELIEVYE
ncbi:DUF2460 domain-containing protein, partial [Rickettsiaceae bacterium]|nr:DUF2460 domain-containing protein [Rickettsiaceae bacterium]